MQRVTGGAWGMDAAQPAWLAVWSSRSVTAHIIKHDDPRKQVKSPRRV
jgi:hypothetical protein